MASKSLIYEDPTDYQQVYTPEQVKTALAQSGLPQEDQDRIATSFQQVAQTNAETSGTPSVSSVTPAASNPAWIYAVNMPSTYPDFGAMKNSGTGIVVDMDDPNAATLIAEAKRWGVPVAIQVGAGSAGDMTPEQYAQRVAQAQALGPDMLVLDIEGAGKGTQGSAGWEWSQQAAALVKPIVGSTAVAVTMEPHQDDYNYNAFQGLSGAGDTQFWVQAYQGDMTSVDPGWATASAQAATGGKNVIAIFGPTTPPPTGYKGGYVSFGIPLTGVSSAGIFGPNAPSTSNTPFYPGQVPIAGAGSGQTPGPPIFVNPGGQFGGGENTPPPGTVPGTGTPPPPGGSDTTGPSTDWSAAYFASFGLPADVANKVNEIFTKYPDTNQAIQFALAYIRGTPWYKQTFPGIEYGMQHGIISDENSYRQYVTALNTLSERYWGRSISGSEVSSYLYEGLTPDIVGKQYEGLANVMANSKEYNYYLGAFSEEGQQSTDNLRSLGNEQAGLDTPMGQRLNRAFQQALGRYQRAFTGSSATPSLSLGKSGLTAPSLLGGNATPDIGA